MPAQPLLMWGHGTARTVCRSQLWRLPQTRPSSQKLPAEPGMARCPRPRAPGRSPTGRSPRPGTRALPPGLLHLPEPRHGCGCHVGAAQPSCLQVTSAWGRPHWSRTPRPAAHRAGPARGPRGVSTSQSHGLCAGAAGAGTQGARSRPARERFAQNFQKFEIGFSLSILIRTLNVNSSCFLTLDFDGVDDVDGVQC